MKFVFFDTETTGLLKPSPARLSDQPYIVELFAASLILENNEWKQDVELNSLIKPPIPLPEETVKITGIKDNDLEGQPEFIEIYPKLANLFTGADFLVAHNLPFDRDILFNELMRHNKEKMFPWPRNHICTVEASMALKGYRLNLTKLHYLATGKGFSAHRARDDVYALIRSFNWLLETDVIDLEKYI